MAPVIELQLVPPLVDCCHCTVGAGVPDAAAVNVALDPATTLSLAGSLVIEGANVLGAAAVTVSVAAWVVALAVALVNTARYSSAFSLALATKL